MQYVRDSHNDTAIDPRTTVQSPYLPFEKYGHAMSQCRCAVLADERNTIGVQDTGQIPPSQTLSNPRG